MEKRVLTEFEIKSIVNRVVFKSATSSVSKNVTSILRNKIRKQLQGVEVYPALVPKIILQLKKQLVKTLVPAGDAVGVITAQSVGERQTQMTLNTFHRAGLISTTVVTGVPRFSELLNATKNQKAVSSTIVFNPPCKTIAEARRLGSKIVLTLVSDVVEKYKVERVSEESWYKVFCSKKEIQIESKFRLRCVLKRETLFTRKINPMMLCQKIEEEFEDLKCIVSPLSVGILDIFFDPPSDDLVEVTAFCQKIMIPQTKQIPICGVSGITEIFYQDDDDGNWFAATTGSNFKTLASLPFVDFENLLSNDMWEIYHTLGVEAAREFLIEEFTNVVSSDGTYINARHIMLIADIMTQLGGIVSVSRYGMKREITGPVAKASFEESLDNFMKAGAFGEVETTKGCSASVMIGKTCKLGAGLCDIVLENPVV